MKPIIFNGVLTYARNYDECLGWAEVPYVVDRNDAPYSLLSRDIEPILIIKNGEVIELGHEMDGTALIQWAAYALFFYFMMYCAFYFGGL